MDGLFTDGFLKGLQTTAENTFSNVSQSIGQFVQTQAQNTLVRIGVQPTGNLSAAQISAGQRGDGIQLRGSSQNPQDIARADTNAKKIGGVVLSLPLIAMVGVGAYFILKK